MLWNSLWNVKYEKEDINFRVILENYTTTVKRIVGSRSSTFPQREPEISLLGAAIEGKYE